MSGPSRATWSVHLGDLAATITGPTVWAKKQRALLEDYLPGPEGRQDLGRLHLDVRYDDLRVNQLAAIAAMRSDARQIETIPGVTTVEMPDGPRARVLTVLADGLEGEQGTHAVRITDDRVELLLHSASRRQHRLPLRLMREAMIRTYENAGATLLHAAGATAHGVGVALCGPRAAGKTTTLAAVLTAGHGDLLSNDRLLLPPLEPGGQDIVAVPLPVPLARGTIEAVDPLRSALATARRPQPPLDSLPRAFGSPVKAELTAREFAAALGGRLAASARLGLLFMPRLTDDDISFAARPLGPAETREVLAACCFTPFDEFWLVPWLIPHRAGVDELIERSRRHIADVAVSVRAVEIRFGVHNPFAHLVDGVRRTLDRPL